MNRCLPRDAFVHIDLTLRNRHNCNLYPQHGILPMYRDTTVPSDRLLTLGLEWIESQLQSLIWYLK